MKFAVNVLNFGPGANPRSLRDWAEFAESAGYHAVMISDHIAVTPDIAARYPEPFYDGFTVLAWLAGITSRVELGTTVTVLPYRHPLQVARAPQRAFACSPRKTKQVEFALATCLPSWSVISHSTYPTFFPRLITRASARNRVCQTGRKKLMDSAIVVKDSSAARVVTQAIPMAASARSHSTPP